MWKKAISKHQRADKNNDVLEEASCTKIKLFGITISTKTIDYICDRPDGRAMGLKQNKS